MMSALIDEIGEVITLFGPDAYGSDATAASDGDAGIPIVGMRGILFVLAVGDLTATGTVTVALNYSSTGNASDAGTDTDLWHASDAVFAAVDSDGENETYLLWLDLQAKGMADAAGKIFATMSAPPKAGELSLIAIPQMQTSRVPCTNANTVVRANGAP